MATEDRDSILGLTMLSVGKGYIGFENGREHFSSRQQMSLIGERNRKLMEDLDHGKIDLVLLRVVSSK